MKLNAGSLRAMPYLALALAAVAAAFSAPLNKWGLSLGLPSLAMAAWRMVFTFSFTAPISLLPKSARGQVLALTRRDLGITALGGLLLAAHFALWVIALSLTDAFAATTLCNMNVVFSALGSYLLFKERLPRSAVPGLVLALAGAVVTSIGGSGGTWAGNLAALLSGATMSGYYLCGHEVRRRQGLMGYTFFLYLVCALALAAACLALKVPLSGYAPRGILAAALLALVCTLLGHSMQSFSLRYISATTLSIIMLSEAITGPAVVFLWFGERVGLQSAAGGALILGGILWYMRGLTARRAPLAAARE